MKEDIAAMTENIVRFLSRHHYANTSKKHGSTMKIASLLILNIKM